MNTAGVKLTALQKRYESVLRWFTSGPHAGARPHDRESFADAGTALAVLGATDAPDASFPRQYATLNRSRWVGAPGAYPPPQRKKRVGSVLCPWGSARTYRW